MFCRARKSWFSVLLLAVLAPQPATAGAPDWVLALRSAPEKTYPPGTKAVCLVDWGRTVITESGEIKSRFRMAYRILAREATGLAWIRLPFDPETKISDLKAWNLKGPGVVHEITMKDATETQLSAESGILFDDSKVLMLFIPQVDVDSIIAFEYERRHRPQVLQDVWYFQQIYPVVRSRFELETPKGWEYRHRILNHASFEPRPEANLWVWELSDLPAIPEEEGMPPRVSVAATLAVSYFPARSGARGQTFGSWDDVARWAHQLMEPRFTPSAEITATAQRLATPQAMGEFVQKQVRYVAIEIGIGGYQPHLASETFSNRYGDCKDKVTLLRSMLRARDLTLYPVLIHTNRRGVIRDFPSPLNFNHMIAAIPMPSDALGGISSTLDDPERGKLLLFDPTDDSTPFGLLPPHLQGTSALLVDGSRGHIIEVPVAPSSLNRRLLTGAFTLSSDGKVTGSFRESAWGHSASVEREGFQGDTHDGWMRQAENWIAVSLPGVAVRKLSVSGLHESGPLSANYEIEAPHFVQAAGDLLVFRPSLLKLGLPWPSVLEKRAYPFQFGYLRTNGYLFDFELPQGFAVEALPEPVELITPYAAYRQKVTLEGTRLTSSARLEINSLSVAADDVRALHEFFGKVERADNSRVVLKRRSQPSATTPAAKPAP